MISVILPVYNVINELPECVESILAQTYSDFELIVVEDCSTDGSREMCAALEDTDPRIKVIYHEENSGLSAARNTGIDTARGEYIAFIDSDDYVADNYLERLLEAIEKNDAQMSVCGVTEVFGEKMLVREAALLLLSPEEALCSMLYRREIDVSAWGKLYKKELFASYRFTNGIYYEDLDIMPRLVSECNSISVIPDALYFYRHREQSITRANFNDRQMVLLDIAEKTLRFADEKYPSLHNAAVRRYVYSNLYLLNMMVDSHEGRAKAKLLIGNVRKNAAAVLKDSEASKQDKLGTLAASVGYGTYKVCLRARRKHRGKNL